MFFDSLSEGLDSILCKSADFINKPFIHSVVKINGDFENIVDDNLNLTAHILCRDSKGNRIMRNDIEIEIFKSNNELILVLAKLHYPQEPLLWSGTKNIWMDSTSGRKCFPPKYSFSFENLASRIKSFTR